eukprot:gene34460-biopygen30740
MHLELEAVCKTVQPFLWELTGKVVRLYCDNQAVVAMLTHFTSRNPKLMQRMRRMRILLDLNDIELQARLPDSADGVGAAPQTGLVRGCKVRVYWPVDDAWYPGTVGDTMANGSTHVTYDDGDEEDLDMERKSM